MPVEPREAGRWKRERQNNGTNTVGSAGNGSTRRRDPCSMGMGGTNGLDRAHVDNPGNGDRELRIAIFRIADLCLVRRLKLLLQAQSAIRNPNPKLLFLCVSVV